VEELLTESAEIPRDGRLVSVVLRDRRGDRFRRRQVLDGQEKPWRGGRRLCLPTTTVCHLSWQCIQRRRPGVPIPRRFALDTANTIGEQVSPQMRFTQVKNLAVQAGLAGKKAGLSNRSSPRVIIRD
jgi:hypothetical protein